MTEIERIIKTELVKINKPIIDGQICEGHKIYGALASDLKKAGENITKFIEQYVIKARIEELDIAINKFREHYNLICDLMLKENPQKTNWTPADVLSISKAMNWERRAELKKGLK